MEFKDRLKDIRQKAGMTQKELAERSGISYSYVTKLESGEAKNPTTETLSALSCILNAPLSAIFDFGEATNSSIKEKAQKILTKLPLYDTPVSAGTGVWLVEGHEYAYENFEDAPKGADFALRVRGDSMEPVYSHGDIVFVRANIIVESGQIGVFCLNGEGYLKQLQGNKLVSLNPVYKPIVIEEYDSFFICGRVIGKASM